MLYLDEPPAWHKQNMIDAGWLPCPADERCECCGRLTAASTHLCCGAHNEELKFLPVHTGATWYPAPTVEEMLAHIENLESELRRYDARKLRCPKCGSEYIGTNTRSDDRLV